MARAPLAAAAVLALLGSGCGYVLATGVRLRGGATRAAVRPFENLSTDPALGAVVATALREELARRGGAAGDEGGAVIEGEVRTDGAPGTLPSGVTQRVVLHVRARVVENGAVVAEKAVRREAEFLGGADALEAEGRRAQALQRLAREAAALVLDGLEE